MKAPLDDRSLARMVGLFFVFVATCKVLAASQLSLFGDEAFYWMCSRRPDIAYADHPFMTALLVRGGSELLGSDALGARALFLLLGALFPGLVWWLARPLVGSRDACSAAFLSMVAPITAHLGLLAIPDVPLLVFAAAALLAFERATRTASTGWWLGASLACALGLCTHLRFLLVPLAFLLYLVATPRGRSCWRTPGPWLLGALALPGLLPVLLYNLRLDFAPLRYQLFDRHRRGADFDALLEHVPDQMLAVTPLLYVAAIAVLVVLVRRWRRGDDRAALLSLFALVHLGVYLLASPFADSSHITIHWPAPGYLPLLPFVPELLRGFVARGPSRARRGLAFAVPGFAALFVGLLLFELGTHAIGVEALRRPFQGWREIAAEARRQLDAWTGPRPVPVAAGHYKLAGNLELLLGADAEIFVLDHRKNFQHGRAPQFRLWGNGETGLRAKGGDALVVTQPNELRPRHRAAWTAHIEALFEESEPLSEIVAPGGRAGEPNRVLFLHGRGLVAADEDR